MAEPLKDSNLNDVVEQLKELNSAQEMAHDAARYTQELRDYVQNEGDKLDSGQLVAIQDLIEVLKDGRLDELEAANEDKIRAKIESKKDTKRNDLLERLAKLSGQNVDILRKEFGGKSDNAILATIIRTAIKAVLAGFLFGAFIEPFKLLGKGIGLLGGKIGKLLGFGGFFSRLKGALFVFGDIIKAAAKAFTSQFFPKGGKGGAFGTIFKGVKDLVRFFAQSVKNLTGLMAGAFGFFSGRLGALKGLTKLNFAPPMDTKTGKAIIRTITGFFSPLKNIQKLFGAETSKIAAALDRGGKAVSTTGGFFSKLGTNIFKFLNAVKPLKTAFEFLGRIGKAFFGLGQILGRFFIVISGIIGAVKGAFGAMEGQEGFINKTIAFVLGGIKGAVNAIFMAPLDFFKNIIAWVLNFFGFENAAGFLKSFSFEGIVSTIFDTLISVVTGFISKMQDMIADIGIGGIIKNLGISYLKVVKKMAMFPLAMAAGGLGAVAAMLPGGKTPMEGFKEAFDKVFTFGDDKLDSLKAKADGVNKDGFVIQAKSEEGIARQKELEEARTRMASRNDPDFRRNLGGNLSYDYQNNTVNVITPQSQGVMSSVSGVIANVYD